MPPLPVAVNIVKVRLIGQNQNTPWNNILHLQYTGTAPGVAECTIVGNGVMLAWATHIAALTTGQCSVRRVEVVDLTSPTAAEGVSDSVFISGTRVGVALPVSIALVVSWLANLRYRGGHSRSYMPLGTTTDIFGGNQFVGDFVTEALAGARAFRTALNAIVHGTTTYKLVVLSYRTAHALRPQPLPVTVQDAAVHTRIDSQRRRTGKETT
jgi:hypothetical protein